MKRLNLKINKFLGLSFSLMILQACSLPQAIGYNISHSLGADAPQSAPSIIGEKRKTGNPYKVFGRWYTPLKSSDNYRQHGVASWYGKDFHAKKTANGEDYNMYAYTAAHKTLPLPTYVRVTNTQNGKSIVVRVNDRGPFVKDRLIDMSYAGAKALGFDNQGTAPVLVESINIHGGDVRKPIYKSRPAAFANKQKAPQNKYQRSYKPATPAAKAPHVSFTTRIANRDKRNSQSAKPATTNNTHAAVTTATAQKYFIQLGSFTDINNARKLYYQAHRSISGVKITSLPINGRTYYRVVIEDLKDLNTAESKLNTIKQNGFYNAIIAKVK